VGGSARANLQQAVATWCLVLQGGILCPMLRPGGQTHAHQAGGRPARRRLSKFYIKEACLKQRDNELGLDSYNTLTCPAASDAAASTCASAFQLGAPFEFTEPASMMCVIQLVAFPSAEPAPVPARLAGPEPSEAHGALSRPHAAAHGSPLARAAARRRPAPQPARLLGPPLAGPDRVLDAARHPNPILAGRAAKPESLLTAGNATDAQSFDSGNVCASNGDRGYVYVTNGCATPITVGLEVRRRRRARERAARRRLWAKKLLGTRVEAQREQGGRALCVAPPCGRSPAGPDPQRAAQQRLALAVALGPETRVAPCLEARRRDHGAWLMTLIG